MHTRCLTMWLAIMIWKMIILDVLFLAQFLKVYSYIWLRSFSYINLKGPLFIYLFIVRKNLLKKKKSDILFISLLELF